MQRLSHVFLWPLLSLYLLVWTAAAQDKPWISSHKCGTYHPVSPVLTPFWITSFRGSLDVQSDKHTELNLDILAVHNESLIGCNEIDISLVKRSVEFQNLGHTVGQLEQLQSTCPEPITDTSNLPGDHRFCSYHIVYSFPGTYPLHTLTSAPFRFQRTDGRELDCSFVRITPYIGASVSSAFIFTPLSVLALLAFSSWQTHLGGDAGSLSALDHSHNLVGQSLLWATVRDVTGYLRHLQFLFVSASMTVEYPGFYVPAVGKLAWANLLYWSGPVDSHYSYKGPHGGMYTSNSSYGLGFMTQMLEYPNMLDTLANSLINLALLAVPTFIVLLLVLFKMTKTQHPFKVLPVFQKAGGITIGMALCFFSVPLLAYVTYDLILVGYLPNYRIGLAVLMMLIILGADYFLTLRIYDQVGYRLMLRHDNNGPPQGSSRRDSHKLWRNVSEHLPHSLPLIQAVAVGALQYYPLAQILVLAGAEGILLLHGALKSKTGPFASTELFCSAIRLITALLNVAFFTSASVAMKEWVGYTILGLHGLLVLPLVFLSCVWRLYRRFWRKAEASGRGWNRHREQSSLVAAVDLRNLRPQLPTSLEENSKKHDEGPPLRYGEHDPSSFYRTPRSQSLRLETRVFKQGQPSGPAPSSLSEDTDFDIDSALSQITPGAGIDYSIRESDLFYGVRDAGTSSTAALAAKSASGSTTHSSDEQSSDIGLFDRWKGVSTNMRWPRPKEKEKGFHVMRPPRPPMNNNP